MSADRLRSALDGLLRCRAELRLERSETSDETRREELAAILELTNAPTERLRAHLAEQERKG